MATVEVTFTPLPVHVRTARLVATAVARRSGVAESLLDEVRLAVGEACSRAVEAHLRHCPDEPIRVALTDDGEQFEVVVTDAVPDAGHGGPVGTAESNGNSAVPSAVPAGFGDGLVVGDGEIPLQLPDGVGLAVIRGLADDVQVASGGRRDKRHDELETPLGLSQYRYHRSLRRLLALAALSPVCPPLSRWQAGLAGFLGAIAVTLDGSRRGSRHSLLLSHQHLSYLFVTYMLLRHSRHH